MRYLKSTFHARPVVAGVVVSVVTLALIGGVIVTTTSMGCGPAHTLGLKPQRCIVSGSVVALLSPSPNQSPGRSPFPSPSTNPTAGPYPSPASGPYPTSPPNPYPNPASGPFPPDTNPASASYPPFYPPASSAGPPTVTVSCRLPIYAGQNGSGGFLVFPGGTFIPDPASAVSVPSPNPGTPSPAGPGYGQSGFYGLSYDRTYSRWLPVPPAWVAPDGKHYAYPSPDSIYVVDVASGTQTEIGIGHQWAVLGVQAAGVYATQQNQAGLWFWPFSGNITQITPTGFWQAVSKDAAYGTQTSGVPQGAANTIIRFDFKSPPVDWFTRAGGQGSVAGFDAQGDPIIYMGYSNGSDVWIATGQNSAVPIGGSTESLNFGGQPIGDAHGVWFQIYVSSYGSNGNSIFLYVPGSGLYGMSSLGGSLAGGCY